MAEKEASRILEQFEKAKRERQKKDSLWRELDAFDRGEQWGLEGQQKPPEWVPKPVTNFVHLVKTMKKASLAIDNPTGMLLPQQPDDEQIAKKFQNVYEFVWKQMKAKLTVREVLETGKLLGTGIAQVYYDDSEIKGPKGKRYKGEIKAKQIDPASFYPSPNAFRLEDCEYIHLVYRRPVSWVKKKFGISDLEARELANNEQGEIYQRDYNSEDRDKVIDFREHYEKKPNENGGFNYTVTYLAGEKVVQKKENLRPNCYPFVLYYDFPQRQSFWAQSTCELILDNQKLINKVESILALIGTLTQNPQKVVNKRSGIDPTEAAKHGSTPGYVFVSNIDPRLAMAWQTPPQIPQALFNLAETAKQNIREITGLTEAYMGQTVGSLQTSGGVNSLIERSTLRDRDQMVDFESFIEDFTRLILKFVVEYYDDERYMRIMGEDGQSIDFEAFKGTDYQELEYDIHVDVSAKAPISRARRQEENDKLLTLQGQMQFDPPVITPQEYIKDSDMVDKEKRIARMNMDEINSAQQLVTETYQMMMEALQSGQVPPEEVAQMGQAMIEQRFQEKQQGTGSTSENAGQMQSRQGAPQG